MSRVLETVETTSGDTWYKAEDSANRTYYVKEGEGRQSSTSWAAAKSHSRDTAAFERGEFEPESAEDLGAPFDAPATVPVDSFERATVERVRAAEANRWLGFRYADGTPDDDVEAAAAYREMRQRLADVDNPERVEAIKEDYGVGGS